MNASTRERGKRISEMVEDEATKAEAEEGEHAEEAEAVEAGAIEPDDNDEPDDDDGASIEASLKAFEAEVTRHDDAVREIMGADFDAFGPCPTCDRLGYAPLPVPVIDQSLSPCTNCNTLGYTITPSGDPLKRARDCMICQTNGYVTRVDQPPTPDPTAAPPVPRFDPYTGAPLDPSAGATPTLEQVWAPGYTPPPRTV